MNPTARPDPAVPDAAGTAALAAHVDALCRAARPAARALARTDGATRARAILAAADAIERGRAGILAANRQDLAQAERDGLSPALIDRLRLDERRFAGLLQELRSVAVLPDPVGAVLERRRIAQDIPAEKIAVPIGVVAIVFESRPNVTVDAASLCLRSGNACILRGGKEAVASNRALAAALQVGLAAAGLDPATVQLVQEQDRRLIPILLAREDALDVVIPRGGEALIQAVVACSRVPVIKHDKGVCSLYIHAGADQAMALALVLNAKVQRPSVCNAIEQILVDRAIAPAFLPRLAEALHPHGVELRADAAALPFLPGAIPAQAADFTSEFQALILAVAVVDGLDAAIAFTEAHGSHHSDGIVTADAAAAERYLQQVDSACVYHNASTRFTDGGQFGFGAEVGISTSRLHARGPMGLRELCTYKWVVRGQGEVRS